MAQFETVNTFVDGDVVNAAALNNIIDQATALTGLITDPSHPLVSAATGDLVLLSRAGALKTANVATLPQGVTSIDLTAASSTFTVAGPHPITTTGNWAINWNAQAANKVLAGPVTGSAAPTFRELDISDYVKPTVLIAALAIDWSLGSVFSKALTAHSNFTFSNPTDGQTIRVRLVQNASWSVVFPTAVRWPGGTAPTMSAGTPGVHDIFEFTYVVSGGPGVYYGKAYQNYT